MISEGIFLVTGVLSTVLAQQVFYEGVHDKSTLLLPFLNYFGV
jgi:hypothetical protein